MPTRTAKLDVFIAGIPFEIAAAPSVCSPLPVIATPSRTQVELGRSSVNTIEIVKGLKPGDQVILSDMSQWDSHDRIKLN